MKTYTITVNGKAYAVTVEEGAAAAGAPVPARPRRQMQWRTGFGWSGGLRPADRQRGPARRTAAPWHRAPAPAAAPAGAAGSVQVTAPMPGKVVAVKASVGQAVKKGEVVLVLEAMKMENDIVAPEDGTIASINVANGDAVESGAVLATLN